MRNSNLEKTALAISLIMLPFAFTGCRGGSDVAAEAPPPAEVQHEQEGVFQVANPEQFPLATATEHQALPQLAVTGVVNPDIARTVPVVTLASGRVVDIRARLGDTVQKGQLLLRIRSDDVSGGYDAYRKAVADELLARKYFERAKDLYAHGAIAQADLEAAEDAEDDAKVTLETATEHLRLLGNDPEHPTGIVDIAAPITGVITDQEVVLGSTIQSYSANPFTISDLSYVWVVCDVYENDISALHLGQATDIHLNAYPSQVLKGTISNIGAILDPTIRTAKVRIEVPNPGGIMRVGMFATATFHGMKAEIHAAVPASAILHLHDRDWVYVPSGGKQFRRVEVTAGNMLPNNVQEIVSGVQPGQQVVKNALDLQNAIDNQ